MTELDDAIEQLLARYIPDAHQRIQARNGICALITTAGGDVAAPVRQPDELLARIDTTLDDCDATRLPLPKIAAVMRVPREMVEANPVRIEDQLAAEHEHQALVDALDQHTRKHRSRLADWLLGRGRRP